MDLKERAVGYVLNGGKLCDAGRIFEVSTRTISGWLRRWREEGTLEPKQLGSRPWKLDHAAIVNHVKINNDNMLEEYARRFNTHPSVIDYVLKKHGITRKKTTLYAERDEEKRAQFLAEIAQVDPQKIVYIDESGVDDTMFPQYARAPRELPVIA